MKKNYQKPEFQIICQNQANAKFFVASGDPTPAPTQGGPADAASGYDVKSDSDGLQF